MQSDQEQAKSPTIVTILGGTGDLARKKLLPAFFDLHARGLLPSRFKIIGFARSQYSDDEYRAFVREHLADRIAHYGPGIVEGFLGYFHYISGNFDDPQSYSVLSDRVIELENAYGQCANKLFYLAVPPPYYDAIFHNIANAGLSLPCSDETGWTRILVEKPFGRDITTARELDNTLSKLFKEEQIFRIDHYLGKKTLQDILLFRFSNIMFEPIWNKEYIEKVEIMLHEEGGVGTRGSFYDGIGALRDVGQNHMLQMLAVIVMEHPGVLDHNKIREARAAALKALRPVGNISENVVRGRYKGYADEHGVAVDSTTETYFKIKTFVDTERFWDVPFYLESGKALNERKAEIIIYFKTNAPCLCNPDKEHHPHANTLRFRIQPDEGISILFWARKSGLGGELEPKELSFLYNGHKGSERIPDAYEKILFDAIIGDQTLFTSTDEVTASWEFITPILEGWRELPMGEYERGSAGPQ